MKRWSVCNGKSENCYEPDELAKENQGLVVYVRPTIGKITKEDLPYATYEFLPFYFTIIILTIYARQNSPTI
jgi:hypothetical protein